MAFAKFLLIAVIIAVIAVAVYVRIRRWWQSRDSPNATGPEDDPAGGSRAR